MLKVISVETVCHVLHTLFLNLAAIINIVEYERNALGRWDLGWLGGPRGEGVS